MQETRPYGTVRGAPSNGCPYRDRAQLVGHHVVWDHLVQFHHDSPRTVPSRQSQTHAYQIITGAKSIPETSPKLRKYIELLILGEPFKHVAPVMSNQDCAHTVI